MGERDADFSDVSRVWAAYRHIFSLHIKREARMENRHSGISETISLE